MNVAVGRGEREGDVEMWDSKQSQGNKWRERTVVEVKKSGSQWDRGRLVVDEDWVLRSPKECLG